MKIINLKYIALIFIAITISCDDFLDVQTPKDQLDTRKVFTDNRTATSALTNVYSNMRKAGFLSGGTNGIGYLLGCYTDETEVITTESSDPKSFFDGSVTSSNLTIKGLWSNTYSQLYMVNNVIEGLNVSQGVSENVKNQLLGEALAIRGILHFYLTQTFGDVPYIKTTDYGINKVITKIAVADVMRYAIEDLKQAEALLEEKYPSTERVRINKTVVHAFLARLYLYTENWQLAKQYSELVISNPIYVLENLENVFLKDSKSAIWQFKPEIEGRNASEAESYIFEALPPPYVRASYFLINSFEINDLRKTLWLKFVEESENAHAYKYKTKGNSSPSKEYSVIIRIEEMYLIAAEAAAELGDLQTCNVLLNLIRYRANLPTLSVSNKIEAVEAVLKERRVELFCEFGHRFYDLKRKMQLNDLLITKPFWKIYFDRLPLPENELLLNSNLLPQNAGY